MHIYIYIYMHSNVCIYICIYNADVCLLAISGLQGDVGSIFVEGVCAGAPLRPRGTISEMCGHLV